jgi:hypothetical protein
MRLVVENPRIRLDRLGHEGIDAHGAAIRIARTSVEG